jgi:nicotinamide mononucleotide transporter
VTLHQWLEAAATVLGIAMVVCNIRVIHWGWPLAFASSVLSFFVLWRPAVAWLLAHHTDSAVPWWDAFPTAGSIVGTVVLARKFIENWLVWIVVNMVSVALFAHQGLWWFVALYAVFTVMAALGWRAWRQRLGTP